MPDDSDQWDGVDRSTRLDSTGITAANGGLSRRQVLGTAATVAGTGLLGTGVAGAQTSGLDGRSWELTWSDEFDQGSIDTSTWSFETGGGCGPDGSLGSCNWGNNESQYYTDGDNAWVENDRLVIEAREEQVSQPEGTYQYTSSRMVTAGSVSKQYGRIDVRARLPIGQGIWPALWMLPEPFVTWPDEGEIDVMEYLGHEPATVHATVHGPGYSGADGINGSYQISGGTFHEDFHVFSLVWDPDQLQWYVDGNHFHTVTRSEVESAGNEWVFDDKPFHLLFNIAVGGEWPGYPDETTEFPQRMEVDYVRFYEESDGSGDLPQVGGSVPQDLDGDGMHRDLNANGRLDSDDVVTYFDNMEDPAITGHVDAYDYNGNERIDFDDVVTLFESI